MKKQKLNLKSLQVKSFVTKIAEETSKTVKGGEQTWEVGGGNCFRNFTTDCYSAHCNGSDNC